MKSFFNIIKSDYLQRTRSYTFLITLCTSLAIAFTFVPEPNANYSTIRIADHVGYYNSSWFGYVTAIMTSIFLSLIGFYLVNSGIKKDIETRVGQIVASTPISNFKYLLSKVLSNFLVLTSIVGAVFIMSLVLFLLYNDGFPFEPLQFIKPYVYITLPAMFLISVVAVVFEVILGKYRIVQQLAYFFLFSIVMVFTPETKDEFALDVFGTKIVMYELEETVRAITNTDEQAEMSIGYVLGNVKKAEKFEFNGVDFPSLFLISRLMMILLGIGIITGIAPLFHRFNLKERVPKKKSKSMIIDQDEVRNDIVLSSLPVAKINYGIGALLKIEMLMLVRKGKKWLWLLNIIGMGLLVALPLDVAHQLVLPVLWFLQVHRLSDIATKELANNIHYFAFASYKPITRLFLSQVSATIILMLVLALPLIIRLGLQADVILGLTVALGGILIVLFSVLLGMLSKGKKLFEVIFFMITYANINGIPFADYFGGLAHSNSYIYQLLLLAIACGFLGILKRNYELSHY